MTSSFGASYNTVLCPAAKKCIIGSKECHVIYQSSHPPKSVPSRPKTVLFSAGNGKGTLKVFAFFSKKVNSNGGMEV